LEHWLLNSETIWCAFKMKASVLTPKTWLLLVTAALLIAAGR
jgi:hypothetical protein